MLNKAGVFSMLDRQYGKPAPQPLNLYASLLYGPFYAYYNGSSGAHLVVVTGVDLIGRRVYTNNPWGIRGDQTYDEFLLGFAGKPENWDMSFGFVIYPD